jgi:hypothetical protein
MIRSSLLVLLVMPWVFLASSISQADEIVIQNNDSEASFFYSLRDRPDAAWSRTYEIAPGERQSHAASSRVRISYLANVALYAWLDTRKTYRIDDVSRGQLRVVTQVRRPVLPVETLDPENEASVGRHHLDLPGRPATATAENPARAATDSKLQPNGTRSIPNPSPVPVGDDRQSEESAGLPYDATVRIVTVRAIADNTYRGAFPEWRDRMRRIVAGASDYYEREYAIRLVLKQTSAWKYDGVADDLESRWSRLIEQPTTEVDLVVAAVGYGDYSRIAGESAYTGQLGRAAFFGQHLMLADRKDYHENRAKTVLVHELAHVFGAFHVADRKLIMFPGYMQLPINEIIAGTVPFGGTIDQVFAMTREFDFRTGVNSLSPTTQRRIQALYRLHGLPQETRQTDPITEGYKYLQRRAEIVAEQMSERAETSHGVFDGLPK